MLSSFISQYLMTSIKKPLIIFNIEYLMYNGLKGTMNRVLNEELIYEILCATEEIPEGRVATYGQIARLVGRPKNARLVGKVLSAAEYFGEFPCHRVVNHMGRTAPGYLEQRELLEREGVAFKENGCVDIKRFLWEM